jgi:hypothetical protein
MPRVKITFWKPRIGQGTFFDLQEVLEELAGKAAQDRMVNRGPEYTDYLVSAQTQGGSVVGSAARIRMENLPERMNATTGEVGQLSLQVQEGLAEEAFFLYDSGLQVLLLQQNNFFRASTFEHLIGDLAELEDLWLEPVIRKDAWDRFDRMQRIASFDFKLTDLSHRPDVGNTLPSLGDMLDHANSDMNAITAELRLGVGRRRNEGLARGAVRNLVRVLSRDGVSALAVRGNLLDTGKSEEIDFLRERLVFTGEVEYSGRRLDVEQCQLLLKSALREQATYLRSLVRNRGR